MAAKTAKPRKTSTAKKTTPRKPRKSWKDPAVGTFAMWVETPFGPLYPCIRPPHTVPAGDAQTLQVRARRREYLDKFRSRWCPDAGPVLTGEEVTGHKTDYPYRCYVSPGELAEAMTKMVFAIDSEKFKPLVDGPEGLGKGNAKLRSDLHSVYNACWNRQLDLSDGTSSYDWTPGKYGTGAQISKPDPDSPAGICRRNGHWFSVPIYEDDQRDTAHMRCLDCPAVLDLAGNTFGYPNGKAPVKS